MNIKLPNLELLEYKIRENLIKNETFTQRFQAIKDNKKHIFCDLRFEMFPQWWGNTSGGFEGIGGSAMTEEYTTVAHEQNTNTYIVCFGDKPCYIITDPNDEFLKDLKERNIKGYNSAKGHY